MQEWIAIFLPFALLLARVMAFFSILPVFGYRTVPMRVRVALALLMTIFFAKVVSIPIVSVREVHWGVAMLLMTREILTGIGLGMAVAMIFASVTQGGLMIGRQMGMAMASVLDPTSGERSQPMSILFQMTFMMLFLASGGHHVLLRVIKESYDVFPVGKGPEVGVMVTSLVTTGTAMLTYALRLAAPMIGACLLLTVALGVVARAMPELQILMISFPLRLGLGFIIATMLVPSLGSFTEELAMWMAKYLGS